MSLVIPLEELFNDDLRKGLTSKHSSWGVVPLDLVMRIQNGYPYDSKRFNSLNVGMPLIRIRDVKGGKRDTFYAGEYADEFVVKKGDLLIGMDGDFNSALWDGEASLLNQRVCRLFPNEEFLLKKFIYYGVGGYLDVINQNTSSVTVKHLSSRDILKIPFPLPPLAEQNRIVEKLDRLFSSLEIVRAKLDVIPHLLKDFGQAVLSQAVTGKLTVKWKEGKKMKSWSYESTQKCCEKVQSGGTPKGSAFETTGIPFLKGYNIQNQKIDFEYKPQYVSNEIQNSQIKKSKAYPGDVVMNIVGPPLNKVAIIPEDFPEWNLNQAITLFRPKSYLLSKYLYYFFCEGRSVREIMIDTKGVVGQINISLSQCRNFEIFIPPIEEQYEIVSRIETLFTKADIIQKQYQVLKAKIDALPQTILAKAFKGELVAQDPNDEPATELLKRINEIQNLSKKVTKLTQVAS